MITQCVLAASMLVAAGRQTAIGDLPSRLQAYLAVRQQAAESVPRLSVTNDRASTIAASDALAAAIVRARPTARPGDIFTPAIADAIRGAIGSDCQHRFDLLWAEIEADLDSSWLPAPSVNGRWPIGAPLPTMPPDLLKALPPLPPELEYRFMNRALVLRDIDANLIIDFIEDAIPAQAVVAPPGFAASMMPACADVIFADLRPTTQ